MSYFKKYVLVLGFCTLFSIHLLASISDDDISRAVVLENRDEAQSFRLRKIITGAVAFGLTETAFENLELSKRVLKDKNSSPADIASHTHDALERLGLRIPLMIDEVPVDITIEGCYQQLAMASFIAWKDIVKPLSHLSATLSYHDHVMNSDPDGRLARINAVIAHWDKAATFTSTAAFFLNSNHELSSRK